MDNSPLLRAKKQVDDTFEQHEKEQKPQVYSIELSHHDQIPPCLLNSDEELPNSKKAIKVRRAVLNQRQNQEKKLEIIKITKAKHTKKLRDDIEKFKKLAFDLSKWGSKVNKDEEESLPETKIEAMTLRTICRGGRKYVSLPVYKRLRSQEAVVPLATRSAASPTASLLEVRKVNVNPTVQKNWKAISSPPPNLDCSNLEKSIPGHHCKTKSSINENGKKISEMELSYD